jgi:hypothetical protein
MRIMMGTEGGIEEDSQHTGWPKDLLRLEVTSSFAITRSFSKSRARHCRPCPTPHPTLLSRASLSHMPS